MKKCFTLALVVLLLCTMVGCRDGLTEKADIISFYQKNKSAFIEASQTGDFSAIEKMTGVQKVYISETYIDISFGGRGMGGNTQYFGIFFSETDDLCAIDVAGPRDQLVSESNGYRYTEPGGDNQYYVEPLGDHFFYYEARF